MTRSTCDESYDKRYTVFWRKWFSEMTGGLLNPKIVVGSRKTKKNVYCLFVCMILVVYLDYRLRGPHGFVFLFLIR